MLDQTTSKITELVRSAAHPLAGTPHDYDALLDLIGEARFVLIGEASHGTHEFYRERYGCLEYFGADPQLYGYATSLGKAETCEDEVVGQLVELQHRTAELLQGDGQLAEDAFFSAEQNARLAKNAEAYYRAMFRGRSASWNLRDRHMAETLDALAGHLSSSVRITIAGADEQTPSTPAKSETSIPTSGASAQPRSSSGGQAPRQALHPPSHIAGWSWT